LQAIDLEAPVKTIGAVIGNEMRALWRRRSFWILQVVLLLPAGAIILISFFDSSASQVFYGQSIPGLGLLPLLYLVMPILAGPSILRDLESTGELLWSSPLDPLVHHAGLWSGLWLGLLPGTLLQLGGWRLAGILIPNPPPFFAWAYALGLYLLANTLGISLVFLAATLTRRMLPLLLGWTALWSVVFFKVEFMESLAEGYFPMSRVSFWNVFFHNLTLSSTLRLG
jgi:hypothetical protein